MTCGIRDAELIRVENRERGATSPVRRWAAHFEIPLPFPTVIEYGLIYNLGLIVGAATVLVLATRRLRIPTIVLYIVAGLLLGPITGLVTITEAVETISEVGIALLLFLVGMELNLERIKNVGKVAVVAGIGQVVFTALGGFGIAMLLGFTVMESIFIGVALTFSSTVVVVKLLDEKKELNSLYGRIAVGIFLVQDVVVIIALTFLSGLMTPEEVELGAMLQGLGLAFVGMGGLLVAALVASKYLLPPLFSWVAGPRVQEASFIWSLLWCFVFVLAAGLLGLSVEIGAFLAGISLAQLPTAHDLRRRVHPLVSFFIAVFFVSLGIQMEFDAAAARWPAAVVLSLFVLIGNPFIFMWLIAKMGYDEKTSFLTSVTVAQISEFSFIFAALGFAAGVIDEVILSLIGVVGLVTIATSAYMILFNRELYSLTERAGLLRMFGARRATEEPETIGEMRDHVIVVGMNTMGRYIVERLAERGEAVLAIDTDVNKLAGLPCSVMQGDAAHASVLEEAHLDQARLLVSALQIENTNNLLAYRANRAGVAVSIHAFDQSVVPDLKKMGTDYLIDSKFQGTRKMIEELRREGVL